MLVPFGVPLASKDKNECLHGAESCTESDKVTWVMVDRTKAFDAAGPNVREPEPLTNDLEKRLQLAKDAQDDIREIVAINPYFGGIAKIDKDFKFNQMQLALFLFADLDRLEDELPLLDPEDPSACRMAASILKAEAFLAMCMSGRKPLF